MRSNIGLLSAAATSLLFCAAPALGQPATGSSRSFAVTWLWNSFSPSEKDCPRGMNPQPDLELALVHIPESQRAEYRTNQNLSFRILSNRGPKGENVCTSPTLLKDPGFLVAEGGIQDGFDLEAKGGLPRNKSCKHDLLRNPAGATGIDNQLSKVIACIKVRRADQFLPKYFNTQMKSGDFAILVKIDGIDDERNDDDVTLTLMASGDTLSLDAAGKPLAHASMEWDGDKGTFNRVKGRIVNGILETGFVDKVRLPFGEVFSPIELWTAKMTVTFKPDGSAEMLLGGYEDWKTYYEANTAGGGIGETSGGPFRCEALYAALRRNADGYKDPKTGECTRISASYKLEMIPAFAIPNRFATAAPPPPGSQ